MSQGSVIIRCGKCGTKNRVPQDRMRDNPICGRCGSSLAADIGTDHPIDITDRTFSQDVMQCPIPVLLDCWAPWCGPCKMVAPILEQLAKEYAGRIRIAKLNVDENSVTASNYSIQSIPTMLFFKNGQTVNRLVGALPKTEIEKQILTLL